MEQKNGISYSLASLGINNIDTVVFKYTDAAQTWIYDGIYHIRRIWVNTSNGNLQIYSSRAIDSDTTISPITIRYTKTTDIATKTI